MKDLLRVRPMASEVGYNQWDHGYKKYSESTYPIPRLVKASNEVIKNIYN